MKLQRLVGTAVCGIVISTIGGPVLAAENATTAVGDASITYTENTSGIKPTDPEDKDTDEEVIIDPEEGINNEEKEGTLRVDFVSHLKFGTTEVTTKKGEYFAAPTKIKKNNVEELRGNFVQVTDQRVSGANGWKLSAAITKPFQTTGEKKLNGSEISYTLPYVGVGENSAMNPTANSFTLTADNGSQVVASAAKEKGWGTHTVEFGRPAVSGNDATMGKAVKLTVPANTPLSVESAYKAEITWTIAEL